MQTEQEQIEIFENDIELYLKIYCEEHNIEDMKKESQSTWNAALIFIRRNVFKDKNMLKSSVALQGYNNDNSNLNNSTCNSYNIDIVNSICDYYIYICFMYDKEISITGFCNLTGIDDNTIHDWGHDRRALSTSGKDIYKKIISGQEESLSDKLVTGNKNPVGTIAVLNRRFGWASPYASDSNKQIKPLSDADLPKLVNFSSNCTTENPLLNCTKDG